MSHPCNNAPALPTFTPVPRRKDRSNGWKPQVQRAFIEALADTGSVATACRMVGRSTHGAYQLRRQEGAEEFAAAWQAAVDLGIKRVEDVAMDRALNGVEVPVYSYGKLVGSRTCYNDRLLMFMLRNRAADRYGEGRAKGADAIGQMELARKKTEWRKEWEKERASVSPQEIRASIDAKVEKVRKAAEAERAEEWAHLSEETRAAWEHFEQLRARDVEALKLDRSPRTPPRPTETINADPKNIRRKKKVPAPRKTVWTVKDESWD